MTEPTSVRPENLQGFIEGSLAAEEHLSDRVNALSATVVSFSQAWPLGGSTLSGVQGYANRLAETRTFLELLKAAVEAADVGTVDGVATVSDVALNAQLSVLAGAAGIDLGALTGPQRPLEVEPPEVGTVVEHSGYVDDPVCTATGHFLEDEVDLVVPDRFGPLAWPRRYSSRLLDDNAHGRGWWSWADARATHDDLTLQVVAPDGRHITFLLPGEGEWADTDGADVRARLVDGGTEVRWGHRGPDGAQTWLFGADGRPARVDDPARGTFTFRHDGGRLVEVRHEGGRALELRWDGDRIAGLVASDGRHVTYEHRGDGVLLAVHRAIGDRRYESDEDGRIVRVLDADGVLLAENRYDELGRVIRQLAPTGRTTVFRYEPGRRTLVMDETGELIALYVHDVRGRVELAASPEGPTVTRRFDADGVVVEMSSDDGARIEATGTARPGDTLDVLHHDGRRERFTYDDHGRVATHEVVGEGTTTFRYDGDRPQPSEVAHSSGRRLEMGWGRPGELLHLVDADGVRLDLTTDADGLPVAATDAVGRTSRVERHPSGSPTALHLPDGGTVTAVVDDAGRVLETTDATGVRTALRYTPAGRLTHIEGPGGSAEFEYGPDGQLRAVRDSGGAEQEIELDEYGRPRRVVDAAGGEWHFEHSRLGALVAVTTPSGHSWRRDGADALATPAPPAAAPPAEIVRTSTPGGRPESLLLGRDEVRIGYDAAGAPTTIERDGHDWHLETDSWGRPRRLVSPEGREERIERDAAGRIVEVERRGAVVRHRYDQRGHRVATTNPTGSVVTATYDAAGHLATVTDPAGATTTNRHDAAGRLVEQVDPLGGRVELGYGPDGRLAHRTDQLGRTTRWDRSLDEAQRTTTLPDGRSLRYEHDERGRIVAAIGADGPLARYVYGPDQLLARVEEPHRVRELVYSPSGLLAGWRDGDGQVTWEHHEGRVVRRDGPGLPSARWDHRPDGLTGELAGRRVEVDADADGHTLRIQVGDAELTLDRDAHGHIVGARTADQAITVERDTAGRVVTAHHGDRTTRIAYDGADRLASVDDGTTRTEWRYDLAGRIVEERRGDAVRRFRYDDAHQLVEVDADGTTTRFEYDAAGRRIAEHHDGRTRTFEWDELSRLVAVTDDGERLSVDIDSFGQLCGVGDHRIAWDHAEGRPTLAAIDGEAVLSIGHSAVAVGEQLDPAALLGPVTGNPWGEVVEGAAPTTAVGLPGGIGFAGLIWLGARIYDPATMQFLSPDPLMGMPGRVASSVPYAYAGADPINVADPTGLSGQPISRADFAEMRDAATGTQWGNIAKVGLAVAGTVVMVGLAATGVGLPLLIAAGAGVGAVNAGVGSAIDGNSIDKVLYDTAIGGVIGAGTAWGGHALGQVFRPAANTLLSRAAANAQSSVVQAVVEKPLVEANNAWGYGGDGQYDVGSVVQGIVTDTVMGVGTGEISHQISTRLQPTPDSPLHLPSPPEGWVESPSGFVHPPTELTIIGGSDTLIAPPTELTIVTNTLELPSVPQGQVPGIPDSPVTWQQHESGLIVPGR